jgi:menaquinol-cytochrome c reductase iron-sulfur subunit
MPDRHQKKSKYTTDRMMPGAFEGETVTRRRMMNITAQGAGGIAAAGFLLPSVAFAMGPIFEKHQQPWQDIGALDDFNAQQYEARTITIQQGVGEVGKSVAYVRLRNDQFDTDRPDQYNRVIAVSNRCMHLGCPIRYVQAAQRFICPCHGGVYAFNGDVDGGPPVRPLDRFYTRIVNDRVQVGPRYSVNRELKRFSPRDPAEPLDGIGQYVYPSRPSMRKLQGT